MRAGKSHKGAPAAAPASGGDRIVALPDEILHRVLSFLPAQQAVQTCVLARRWLHLWKHATGLRIVGADGKAPAPFEEVREFVDSLLLLRGSSPLEMFEVRVAGNTVDVRHLRLWVRCPAIQDLTIIDCSFMHAERISSKSLKRLSIERGIFNLSTRTPIHAPNLASLELQVSEGRTPTLERMPLLVSAGVVIMENCDCCSHSNNGDCGDESCKGCIRNDTSSVFLHCISEAETLVLATRTKTFVFRRDLKCCPTFSRLKNLVLIERYVHAIACIIEHSPVLENLELYVCLPEKGFDNVKMNGRFNPAELPSTISPHLKIVKVRCARVDKRVLEVLEFLSKFNISFSFKRKKPKAEDKSSTT